MLLLESDYLLAVYVPVLNFFPSAYVESHVRELVFNFVALPPLFLKLADACCRLKIAVPSRSSESRDNGAAGQIL